MGDTPGSCILFNCEEPATTGKWCRECWDNLIERDISLEAFQPSEILAREVVKLRRQLDFVSQQTGVEHRFGQCCGHPLVVHTDAGCNGLSRDGGFDQWGDSFVGCECRRWVPSEVSSTDSQGAS